MSQRVRGRARVFWAMILGLGLLLMAGAGGAFAADLIRVDASGPVDIRADRVNFDERTRIYLAEGEVEVVRGVHRIYADRCRLNGDTLIAEAEGRVRLGTPTEVITGERLLIDLQGGSGKVYNGTIFVKPTNFYLRGNEIEKTGRDTYRVGQGRFTTCDGSSPAWELAGRDMEVTIEGYGTAYDTTFRVRDFPVFWTPYVVFPAKFRRQSGLLPPTAGYTSRDGFFYSQPWFQTLGDSQDATVTLNYMSSRGVGTGLEYRWAVDRASKGMMMVDYLPSDAMGEQLYQEGKNAASYNSRYWFRMKADQSFFNDNIFLKADIDLVSDQDYLREFVYGYSGYETSKDRFDQIFGRTIDSKNSTVRENKVNIQRYFPNSSLNASLIYYDEVTSDNKNTLHSLPTITYDATRQAVGETGLYFQMNSGYTYYYSQEASKGHIADISPLLSLPLNFNDYVELEPSFQYQQRFFDVSRDPYDDANATTTGTSELWAFYTTASTYLYRVYDMGTAEDPLKMKHAMRPYITYTYQPNVDESALVFLAQRGQVRYNKLDYGVANTFTSKIIGQDEDTGEVRAVYRDFFKFSLLHSFAIDTWRDELQAGDTQPWGAFGANMQIYTSRYFYVSSDASWNPYTNSLQEMNGYIKAKNRRGDSILMDYRYYQDLLKQVSGKVQLAITKEWSVAYTNHKDLNTNSDYQSIYEVIYEGQCWGIRAFYTDDVEQRGFYLAFSLGGFGELLGWGRSTERTGSY